MHKFAATHGGGAEAMLGVCGICVWCAQPPCHEPASFTKAGKAGACFPRFRNCKNINKSRALRVTFLAGIPIGKFQGHT